MSALLNTRKSRIIAMLIGIGIALIILNMITATWFSENLSWIQYTLHSTNAISNSAELL